MRRTFGSYQAHEPSSAPLSGSYTSGTASRPSSKTASLLDTTNPFFSGERRGGQSSEQRAPAARRGSYAPPWRCRSIRCRRCARPPAPRLTRRPARPLHAGITRFGVDKYSKLTNDPFHTLLNLPWYRFIAVFFCTYISQMLLFSFLYWAHPSSCIRGLNGHFSHALWVSSRTSSTLGFNDISPNPECTTVNLTVMLQVRPPCCARRRQHAEQRRQLQGAGGRRRPPSAAQLSPGARALHRNPWPPTHAPAHAHTCPRR
jgi:hypothetical protein